MRIKMRDGVPHNWQNVMRIMYSTQGGHSPEWWNKEEDGYSLYNADMRKSKDGTCYMPIWEKL